MYRMPALHCVQRLLSRAPPVLQQCRVGSCPPSYQNGANRCKGEGGGSEAPVGPGGVVGVPRGWRGGAKDSPGRGRGSSGGDTRGGEGGVGGRGYTVPGGCFYAVVGQAWHGMRHTNRGLTPRTERWQLLLIAEIKWKPFKLPCVYTTRSPTSLR